MLYRKSVFILQASILSILSKIYKEQMSETVFDLIDEKVIGAISMCL